MNDTIRVRKTSHSLSDNSRVYDVHLIQRDQVIVLPVVTERDADDLIDALDRAIHGHTVIDLRLTRRVA